MTILHVLSQANANKTSGQAEIKHSRCAQKSISLEATLPCAYKVLPNMQGPIYQAIEWLDHEGMNLIEQVSTSGQAVAVIWPSPA